MSSGKDDLDWVFTAVIADICIVFCVVSDDEVRIVNTPGFPESVSEGDVKWEKGKNLIQHRLLLPCHWG